MECLDDETLASYLGGAADVPDEVVTRHLVACSSCRRLVSALARSDQAEASSTLRFGRFEIVKSLGEGAAGQVYEALDHELRRRVALKVVCDASSLAARERLVGEAQALARLQHPNVVAVHEVGVDGDTVFLVMERVDGRSLAVWRAEKERAWREVCETLAAAGRGLVAAHAADVIHRDVKPDNILVAATGRVFVADFGLAARHDTRDERPWGDDAQDLSLTATDVVVGTPLYMAPEQLAGAPADERSDQYAFCVTMWEVLSGERLFAATSLTELVDRKRHPIEAPAALPRRLGRLLRRGLDPDPSRRFPSMSALLDELDGAMRSRRRLWLGAGVVAAVFGVAGWALSPLAEPAICSEVGDVIDDSWSDDHRSAIQAAFAAVDLPYAVGAAEQVTARLDAYAQSWRQARASSCRETESGAQSEALGDARAVCLERLRWELDALVELLAQADASMVQRAATAVPTTSPTLACRAERVFARAEEAPKVDEQLGRELAAVQAEKHLGRYRGALEAARAGTVAAKAASDPRSMAGFQLEECEAAMFAGELQDAEAACLQAATSADVVRDDVVRARALVYLVYIVGYHQRRFEDATVWGQLARAAVEREESEPFLEALLDAHLGAVAFARGDLSEASAAFERSQKASEAELGASHPSTLTTMENVAVVSSQLGDRERAIAVLSEVVEHTVGALGPSHPQVGRARHNLGIQLQELGRYRAARRELEEALAVRTASLGRDHANVASTLNALGATLLELGDGAEARVVLERALAIERDARPGSSASMASRLINLAELDRREGHLDDAERRATEAHDLWRSELGGEHANVGVALVVLGRIAVDQGKTDPARERLTKSMVIFDAAGSDEPTRLLALVALAKALRDVAPGEANEIVERAVVIADSITGPPELRAEALLLGARDLRTRDRLAARELAMRARALAATSEASSAHELRKRIELWLAR